MNHHQISALEAEVLMLLVEGYSYERIAKRMSYGERTVRRVIDELKLRSGTTSHVGLGAAAVRRGWL